jgi:hypothetical protein
MRSLNKKIFWMLFIVAAIVSGASAFNWKCDSSLQVRWDYNCDFYGYDITRINSRSEECGDLCLSNNDCTHFTHRDGFCYLKKGDNLNAIDSSGAVCGFVQCRRYVGLSYNKSCGYQCNGVAQS